MLPYVCQVSKYDPADRDQHGHCTGGEPASSDHGPVEAAYLQAVAAFAGDAGVEHLAIREPDGFEGLVHTSEPDVSHEGVIEVGDALTGKVLDVDPVRRRITLSHTQALATDAEGNRTGLS